MRGYEERTARMKMWGALAWTRANTNGVDAQYYWDLARAYRIQLAGGPRVTP